MGKLRPVLLAAIVFGALALAAPAFAGYAPRLSVTNQSQALGSAGVNVKFTQPGNDDPTSKINLLIPKGYAITGPGAPGTKIGTVSASVLVADAKRTVKSTATLTVGNLADFGEDAQSCTSGASPGEVWTFTLPVAGQSFRVPVYVDTKISGAEEPFGVASLTMCFAAGDVKAGTPGRAVLGSQITTLVLSTKRITTPKVKGIYRWRAAVTPFTPGTGTPDLRGAVEIQSLVAMPFALNLSAKVSAGRAGFSRVTLSGDFRAVDQGLAGTFVTLKRGTAASRLKSLGVLPTNRTGQFATKGEIKRTGRPQRLFFQVAAVFEKDLGEGDCRATVPTVRCIDATLAYSVTSRTVAVTVPG